MELEFSKSQVEDSIGGRFKRLAEEVPTQLAFKYQETELSYAKLDAWSNQIANEILNLPEQSATVGVLITNPVFQVVAQLGVLKAGKACIPVDPKFPAVRQSFIFEDAGAKIILSESALEERAAELTSKDNSGLVIDTLDSDTDSSYPSLDINPRDLSYVLYTSGSTGTPKGVIQNHRNLLHVAMLYHQDFGVSLSDRLTSPTALTYTGTIWALLAALMNRATFICSDFNSPHSFAAALEQEEITRLQLITTLLRQFIQGVDTPLTLPSLRKVYTGGEALQREDVTAFTKTFPPHCKLLYNFGSTEAGIISHHPIDTNTFRSEQTLSLPEAPELHVGYPVADTNVTLLDQEGEKVAVGEVGEIVVESDFLSPGYWRDPELTDKHFRENLSGQNGRMFFSGDLGAATADGALMLRGRRDYQIKIRGYRINTEEIEMALRSISGVAHAAVVANLDALGKCRIAAYVQLKQGVSLSARKLREALRSKVPVYMTPAIIMFLDCLPVAENGKLNRRALPDPGMSRPEVDRPYIEPRTETEKYLCRLFSKIMQIDAIGVGDNFLELGGDSITAFRFLGGVKSDLDIEIPPSVLFEASDIGTIAKRIGELPQRSELKGSGVA